MAFFAVDRKIKSLYNCYMMKILATLVAVATVGCASVPSRPIDVALVPNDCANQTAILKWLEQTARAPQSRFQSGEAYERNVTMVKARMWDLRYHCNIVR